MPRLRNTKTDAVVSCSQETADRLGGEWIAADEAAKPAAKKSPAKKPASKFED